MGLSNELNSKMKEWSWRRVCARKLRISHRYDHFKIPVLHSNGLFRVQVKKDPG